MRGIRRLMHTNQDGFGPIDVLIVVGLVGGAVTALVGSDKVKEEFKKNNLTPNQIIKSLVYGEDTKQGSTAVNHSAGQGQTGPVNPFIFPARPAEQSQPQALPNEPAISPNNEGIPLEEPQKEPEPLSDPSCTRPGAGPNCHPSAP